MQYNTLGQRFRHASYLIKNKPKKYWGYVILGVLASAIIVNACGDFSIISLLLYLGISAGIDVLCLKIVNNEDPGPKELFTAFKDFKTAKRVIGGSLWTQLLLSVWLVVPGILAGGVIINGSIFRSIHFSYGFGGMGNRASMVIFVIAAVIAICAFIVIYVIKTIEYSFAPFILVTRDDISPFDAWKESKRLTYGIKGRIFGFIFLPALIFGLILGFMALLGLIPFVGGLFRIAVCVIAICGVVILPYFYYLGLAGFYVAALNAPKIQYQYQQTPQAPSQTQPAQNYRYSQYTSYSGAQFVPHMVQPAQPVQPVQTMSPEEVVKPNVQLKSTSEPENKELTTDSRPDDTPPENGAPKDGENE